MAATLCFFFVSLATGDSSLSYIDPTRRGCYLQRDGGSSSVPRSRLPRNIITLLMISDKTCVVRGVANVSLRNQETLSWQVCSLSVLILHQLRRSSPSCPLLYFVGVDLMMPAFGRIHDLYERLRGRYSALAASHVHIGDEEQITFLSGSFQNRKLFRQFFFDLTGMEQYLL